jgi:hypothetical protein
MDDIIFGGSSHALVSKFSDNMSSEFEMSMMGELNLFLRLQMMFFLYILIYAMACLGFFCSY